LKSFNLSKNREVSKEKQGFSAFLTPNIFTIFELPKNFAPKYLVAAKKIEN